MWIPEIYIWKKILSGKEIILMAPMYEAEEEDGSVAQKIFNER